jgi:hypothetical protein
MEFIVCDIFLYILEYKNEDRKFSSLTPKNEANWHFLKSYLCYPQFYSNHQTVHAHT